MSNLPVYAHRGAPNRAVENSMKAFKRAIMLGIDGLEIDLQLSADGVAFVSHDIDFFRLAGNSRRITDMHSEEILQLKLGSPVYRKFWYSRVMTFDQFLQLVAPSGMKLNVELKESFLGKIEKIIEVVEKTKGIADVHFSSFEFSILQTIHTMGLNAKTAFIGKKNTDWDYIFSIRKWDAIHLNKKFYDSELMHKIWSEGFPMRFYNVKGNEKYIVHPHESVIGWISDYPEKVIQRQKRNLT